MLGLVTILIGTSIAKGAFELTVCRRLDPRIGIIIPRPWELIEIFRIDHASSPLRRRNICPSAEFLYGELFHRVPHK
jgi:hypothetical protein